MPINVQHDKGPHIGYTRLPASGNIPITQTGDTSSSGTTFTATSVTDSSSWALSGITAGMVAKTSGGWAGLITAVNDGTDTLTVQNWSKSGASDKRAAAMPEDGETVTIHRVHMCKRLTLYAWSGNSAVGYVGRSTTPGNTNSVVISNTLTHPSSVVAIEALMAPMLDLTELYGVGNGATFDLTYVAE